MYKLNLNITIIHSLYMVEILLDQRLLHCSG